MRLGRIDALLAPLSVVGDAPPATAHRPLPVALDRPDTLARAAIFAGADNAVIEELALRFSAWRWRAGEVAAAQGEAPDGVWFLVDGELDVYASTAPGKAACIGRLRPNALIGTTSLVEGRDHMATCVCATDVAALRLEAADWRALDGGNTPAGSVLRRAAIRALCDNLACAHACYFQRRMEFLNALTDVSSTS